jgi:hypothetical protein
VLVLVSLVVIMILTFRVICDGCVIMRYSHVSRFVFDALDDNDRAVVEKNLGLRHVYFPKSHLI